MAMQKPHTIDGPLGGEIAVTRADLPKFVEVARSVRDDWPADADHSVQFGGGLNLSRSEVTDLIERYEGTYQSA